MCPSPGSSSLECQDHSIFVDESPYDCGDDPAEVARTPTNAKPISEPITENDEPVRHARTSQMLTGYFEDPLDNACCADVYSNLHLHDQESADNFVAHFMPDLAKSDSLCRGFNDLDRAWLRLRTRDPLSFASDCASVADHSWIE